MIITLITLKGQLKKLPFECYIRIFAQYFFKSDELFIAKKYEVVYVFN